MPPISRQARSAAAPPWTPPRSSSTARGAAGASSIGRHEDAADHARVVERLEHAPRLEVDRPGLRVTTGCPRLSSLALPTTPIQCCDRREAFSSAFINCTRLRCVVVCAQVVRPHRRGIRHQPRLPSGQAGNVRRFGAPQTRSSRVWIGGRGRRPPPRPPTALLPAVTRSSPPGKLATRAGMIAARGSESCTSTSTNTGAMRSH